MPGYQNLRKFCKSSLSRRCFKGLPRAWRMPSSIILPRSPKTTLGASYAPRIRRLVAQITLYIAPRALPQSGGRNADMRRGLSRHNLCAPYGRLVAQITLYIAPRALPQSGGRNADMRRGLSRHNLCAPYGRLVAQITLYIAPRASPQSGGRGAEVATPSEDWLRGIAPI